MKLYGYRLFMACMLGLFSIYMAAQTTFSTVRLKQMAEKLNLAQLDTLKPSVLTDSYTFKGNKLHVATNKQGAICHIGYAMVNPALRNAEQLPLLNFVERYLLELDLPSDFSRGVRLNRDKVEYKAAANVVPSSIGYNDGFAYQVIELKSYRVTWERDGKPLLTLAFPMDAQLLLGCNAIELERNLVKNLSLTPNVKTKLSEISEEALKGRSDSYLDPLITNKIYANKKGGKYELVYNNSNIHQSVCKFALTGYSPSVIPLNLTVDLYGYNKKELQLTYPQLIRFLKEEGCSIYFGIKTRSETMVEGTLFAVQKNLGYCHVVKLDIPTSIFNAQPIGKVSARIYAYIPQHNVSSDYF